MYINKILEKQLKWLNKCKGKYRFGICLNVMAIIPGNYLIMLKELLSLRAPLAL